METGTTVPQSSLLEKVIRDVIETGKTVTFAIKHSVSPSTGADNTISFDDEDDAGDDIGSLS